MRIFDDPNAKPRYKGDERFTPDGELLVHYAGTTWKERLASWRALKGLPTDALHEEDDPIASEAAHPAPAGAQQPPQVIEQNDDNVRRPYPRPAPRAPSSPPSRRR